MDAILLFFNVATCIVNEIKLAEYPTYDAVLASLFFYDPVKKSNLMENYNREQNQSN